MLAVALLVLAGVASVALRGPSDTGTVSTPFLSYTVPDGWVVDGTDAITGEPTALTGAARGPGYDCDGERYVRGFSAAALLPTDGAVGSGPADRAERLARWFAASAYSASRGAAPALDIAPPRPVRVVGPRGLVDGTITEVTVAADNGGTCRPARGTVLVLAAQVSGGAAVLLVAGDTEGGPAEPPPPDPAALGRVLESTRLLQS